MCTFVCLLVDVYKGDIFNFAIEYAIRRVQVNQDGLKLNGMLQIPVFADDVNIVGRRVHTIKENAEALVVASKETGLELNANKTKYMVMSRDQNAGRSHSMKSDNISFESVEEFKFLGTILNQNSIKEVIKSRVKSGNACYNSVQNLLSSRLVSTNLKTKMYRNIILPVDLCGCETWSLTLKEERTLRVFENRVLRRVFGLMRDEVTRVWRKLHNEKLNDLYS
jgi:hypothetical protein